MSSRWSETELTHRQNVALAYDHIPLQRCNLSSRVINVMLLYNHKLSVGDVIRDQTHLGTIGGLGVEGRRELDTKLAMLLDEPEFTMYRKAPDQQRPSVVSDAIGQLPLGLLHLDQKTYQALIQHKILTVAALYQIKSSLLRDIAGFHVDSLRAINAALVTLINTIQPNGTVDWFAYCSARGIAMLPLNSKNSDSVDHLLKQVPKILEQMFTREKETRSWAILQNRFGLEQENLTLEELGVVHNITRERVRQIEAKSLTKLQTIFSEQNYSGKDYHIHPALHMLLQSIQDMIAAKQHKLITERNLLEYAKQMFSINIEQQAPCLFLLLLFTKMEELEFSYPQANTVWGYSNPAHYPQINHALTRLDKFLTDETSLAHNEVEILVRINRDLEPAEQVTIEQIPGLIELCDALERREDGSVWGKFTFLKRRTHQVERLLGEAGRPMSVPALAREINQRLLEQKNYHHISDSSLLNLMCTDRRFMAIGRSGKWSLTSWENIDTKSILKHMQEYLTSKDQPATIDELYNHVSERRPVNKSSIKAYLAMEQSIFTRMGRITWGLTGWDHERKHDAWNKEQVADFVVDFFTQHNVVEIDYQLLKQAFMNATDLNSHQANGLLNHCRALKTQRIGYRGERKAIFQVNYKETLEREKKYQTQPGSIRQQLEESTFHILEIAPDRQMAQTELIRQLIRLHNCPESTVYAAISQMQFIERVTGSKHQNICYLRDTPVTFKHGWLIQRISAYVKKLLESIPSHEIALIDLILRVQKEFSCPRVTAYRYVGLLDFVERLEVPHGRGKLCRLKETFSD